MKKLKCYYAHTMISFNSTIEVQDVELLEGLGFEVINPNCELHQKGCEEYAVTHGKNNVMNYFTEIIVNSCNLVAFRSLPDGSMPSGISKEVDAAITLGLPVIELPCMLRDRMMDYSETKQYFIELGHYKT